MPANASGNKAEGEEKGGQTLRITSPAEKSSSFPAAVIVAHPDDETLWAGGTILTHPDRGWFIAALSRRSDRDRAPKFLRVLDSYNAAGAMGDLEDGPEQTPMETETIQQEIVRLLPATSFEMVFTHAPRGEYTRHRRHEEVSRAVIGLWARGRLRIGRLYLFAYQDNGGSQLPGAIESAPQRQVLPKDIWNEKHRLMTDVYGFQPESWEARTTPRAEAFWTFEAPADCLRWLRETEER
jgi:LmbE family N-acetylglucosaminyl deacetylase